MDFEFSIKNFKCFEGIDIPFRQLTVLAGANSVGKSSVVQSLLLIRQVLEHYRKSGSLELLQEGKNVAFPPDYFSINGPFLLNLGLASEVMNRSALEAENKIFYQMKANNGSVRIGFTLPDEETYSLRLNNISLEGEWPAELSINNFHFYYLNAERIGPRIRHEVEDQKYPHTGWQGEFAIQLIGSYKTRPIPKNRCFDSDQARGLLEQSRLWLDFIAPGTTINDANLIGGIKSAEVTLSGSRPTNIGFGISYVLPIIVNGLIASEGAMLIVENPEAHLHPAGQSRIGQFLATIAASGVQVVVETHSEHVLNGIRIATVKDVLKNRDVVVNYIHKNTDNQVVASTIQLNDAGDLTSYPKGFFDQEQRDIAEIIRERRKKTTP